MEPCDGIKMLVLTDGVPTCLRGEATLESGHCSDVGLKAPPKYLAVRKASQLLEESRCAHAPRGAIETDRRSMQLSSKTVQGSTDPTAALN